MNIVSKISDDIHGDGFKVLLIGRRFAHNENLGLGYLRAHLEKKGYQIYVRYLNCVADATEIADDVQKIKPGLIGLSVPDGASAFLPLSLGQMISKRGFVGHITCGGPFATLARDWLLQRYDWLDSVVRFAGEVPLADLADRLAFGNDASNVPGVTTRAGDGKPSPVFDKEPLIVTPRHDQLPTILGHPAAHIMATRGCKGRCVYCGPAALQTQEMREAKCAGASPKQIRQGGVGGVRRREINDICDEMASLWHKRGVRYFYFVDEHMLPYREYDALEWLDTWHDGLVSRGVGELGVGAMFKSQYMTPAVAARFSAYGLVRAFLGLEFSTAAAAWKFGRAAPDANAIAVLQAFKAHDVATISNLMLIHPYATAASIQEDLNFLEALPAGLFEVNELMVYHGTRLHKTLESEGRVHGNPFRYTYHIDDPVVRRTATGFVRMRHKAFGNYSLSHKTHDVDLSLCLARKLYPQKDLSAVSAKLRRHVHAVNNVYATSYRAVWDWANRAGSDDELESILVQAREKTVFMNSNITRIESSLFAVLDHPIRRFAPISSTGAALLSFVLLGSAQAGCYRGMSSPDGDTADSSSESDSSSDSENDSDTSTEPGCTLEQTEAERDKLTQLVNEKMPCFKGHAYLHASGDATAYADSMGADNNYENFGEIHICTETNPLTDQVEQVIEAELFECAPITGTFEGNLDTDYIQLKNAAFENCLIDQENLPDFRIVVDGDGKVIEVLATGGAIPAPSEFIECLALVLESLTFPCFANTEVCHDYAFICE